MLGKNPMFHQFHKKLGLEKEHCSYVIDQRSDKTFYIIILVETSLLFDGEKIE